MSIQNIKENWPGEVCSVVIGATSGEGGHSAHKITIGGEKSLPCLFEEGGIPNKPQLALEIWDIPPKEWPSGLIQPYAGVLDDPFSWAEKCVNEYKAKLLCVRLQGAHPDFGNRSAQDEADFIKELFLKTKVPLVVLGCGDDEKDNVLLPACSRALKGERCLIGSALPENYKEVSASLLSDGHALIAESPIDVNIAKQLNILISDTGFPMQNIVMNPTIGALGYGLEYAYSIMERARLAALSGDKTLAAPFVCLAGQEAWRAKEAKADDPTQGIFWEVITATALIQAGADLLIMRHPFAADKVGRHIEEIFKVKTK